MEPLIFTIRDHRVMLDADLARLYGVTTKRFNEAFKRMSVFVIRAFVRLREQIAASAAVNARIQQHHNNERKAAFRQFLLPDSTLAVSAERAIDFKTMNYEPSWLYEGGLLSNNQHLSE